MREKDLSKERLIVFLDLVHVESHCFKADPKGSISYGGRSISFGRINGSSHTLGRSVGPIGFWVMLCQVDLKANALLSMEDKQTR